MKISSMCALAISAVASTAMAAIGPTSTLYVMNYAEYGTNTGLDMIQGNTVSSVNSFYAFDLNIAVYGDVRTHGYGNTDQGDKFSLLGVPLAGGPYTNSIVNSQLHDGTSDGNYNYSVDYTTGDVLRFSRTWTSPTVLFNAWGSLPDAGWITMDVSDGTFWLSEWGGTDRVEHRTPGGALIASWNSGIAPSWGLAMDQVDGTLWMADTNYNLYQYSQAGVLLQTYSNGALAGGQPYGMEFDTALGVPEPASMGVLAMGAAAFLARRGRRA